MAKKIKKNSFGISKPGSKKEQEYNYKMKVRLAWKHVQRIEELKHVE